MAKPERLKNEEVLDSFADAVARLLIEHHQKQLGELDLTLPQAQALRILQRGACPTGALATELRISAPAVTQLTDRLIRKGLIERQTAVNDRRCVMVALSAKGRQLVEQFRSRRGQVFGAALEHLDETEQEQFVGALEKVIKALQKVELKEHSNSQGLNRN